MQSAWDILGANKYEIIRGRILQVAGDPELNASHEGQSQSKITVQRSRQEMQNV